MEQPSKRIITELGNSIATVTGKIKETSYIFQQGSVEIQRGHHAVFHWVFHHRHGLHTKNNSSNNSDDNNNINN